MKKGSLLVISGPSGAGKSSLIGAILERFSEVYFSISTTTRPKREGEVEGRDYFFVSKEEFMQDVRNGLFLEWAEVHGNFYGTSLKPVYEALDAGKLVIFDIDVQGHASIRERFDEITTSVFVTTPDIGELRRRLEKRGTDSDQTIRRRLQNALEEMQRAVEYDYLLINSDLQKAREGIVAIAHAARLKYSKEEFAQFLENWSKG